MIKTAIVEDEAAAAAYLADCLKRYGEENGVVFSCDVYDGSVAFLESYDGRYDMVFMDIEMEHLDGMSAAKRLREMDRSVEIIFVTNMARYAIKGYEVDALDFVVKPVVYHDFEFRLKKAVDRCRSKRSAERAISVGLKGGGYAKLIVSHIKYVEIMKHRIVYHTEDGDYESHGTLKNVERELCDAGFARCNSCYLVNLKYVNSVRDMMCDVAGEKLKVSQPRKKEFLQALGRFIGG